MSLPQLLAGLRVLELTGSAGQVTARMLADLGADVVTTTPPSAELAHGDVQAWAWSTFWGHRKQHVDMSELATWSSKFDLVLAGADTPPATVALFPDATWVWVTPYGRSGPRAAWRGSELTCIAASGNLYPTGYPDRAPIACSRPTSAIHGAADAAIGALFAIAAGTPTVVDVSIQEATVGANLGAHTTVHQHGIRGARVGPFAGGVREVWPCADGHVSFAIRGGPARAASWVALRTLLDEYQLDVGAFPQGDAREFDAVVAPQAQIDDIGDVLVTFFRRNTKDQLHQWARERGIMLAPIVGPADVVAHPQLAHRQFFDDQSPHRGFAARPIRITEPPSRSETSTAARPGPAKVTAGIWSGLRILELGSAFAGPMASRYFAEHGATCVHVESERQPDSARLLASTPIDKTLPLLERSPLFPAINARKLSVQFDMKHPASQKLALRLALEWADVIVENFSPRVLEGWGLGYETLAAQRPDLVYASSTMWGHDGPFVNEKGFGGIGQAQSGHVYLTGYPDRDPVFPFGLITDSLTPKITAATIAAALLRRQRTGLGCHIDVSQIETAAYTLGPWLLEHTAGSTQTSRCGNDFAPTSLVHGVFPALGDDRWIAIAAWTDDEYNALAKVLELTADEGSLTPDIVAGATSVRDADKLARDLQAVGVDAYAVLDLVDVCSDPQLSERGHFVEVPHPVHGTILVERSAFRIESRDQEPVVAGPTLGRDTDTVLTQFLGLTDEEIISLRHDGALR